jgi:hypothetical protein
MKRIENIVGSKYGRLTILYEVDTTACWHRRVLCRCDCWNSKEALLIHLRSWKIQSCRCLQKEEMSIRFTKHWLSHTRCERIYRDLVRRCTKERCMWYRHYWWRGIIVEWHSTTEFINDMYKSYVEHCEIYWEKNTTIDRIDVDWNYSKYNCKWSTRVEQAQNTRRNRVFNFQWKRMCLSAIAREINISPDKLRYMLNKWKIDLNNLPGSYIQASIPRR